ncbi:hypothetical protein PO124_17070 [Bacillus licheniformis]|nr:hypothetical protein [Bacillus licheniformis]
MAGSDLSRTVPNARTAKLILDDLIEANKGYWPELSAEIFSRRFKDESAWGS